MLGTTGIWKQVYVPQNGLNLGKQYSVANYPSALNPATDGLRNIAGKVNSDGTVTIWGVTSTVSANGDQGADPNQLVMITDVVANTDPTVAAKEQFTILRTANAGEVLRGVALAPTAGATPAASVPLILSAANPGSFSIAPGSIATANGQNLATTTLTLSPPATSSNGTSVSVTDGSGTTTLAPMLAISPSQIIFMVPATAAPGTAQVSVANGTTTQTANNVEIATVSPGLLTLNGSSLAAASVVEVSASGAQSVQPVYTVDSANAVIPSPIALGGGNTTFLMLFGTGIAPGGGALTTVTMNGVNAPVYYAGAAPGYPGIDQVNVQIPLSLAGKGNVNVQLTTEGVAANPVQVVIK